MIDPKYFFHIPVGIVYGDRVAFTRPSRLNQPQPSRGEGVFVLHWLGIEECWNVLMDDGTTVHLYPCFGDTMESIEPCVL